jgi:putative transposase
VVELFRERKSLKSVLILEYKLVTDDRQQEAIEEAIRTVQFIRNKAIRLWKETNAKPYDLNRYCAVLAKEFSFARKLNSQARQAAAERAAYAISRYLKADKTGNRLGMPGFQKDNRSVEYKTTGWKLSLDRKRITFTDGFGIGKIKMLGTRDLCQYDLDKIKRVRILRRADMYFVQFCLDVDRKEPTELTGKMVGLDMGLSAFYTDSDGNKVACPTYLRLAEKRLKREQRRLSRKQKGSNNRRKARVKVARRHLKVQCQRKDFAVKLARCVVKSHDLVAIEDLAVKNLIRNRHLSKSIADAAWSQFADWLVYFGQVFGKPVVKIPPAYTSQDCSSCGKRVKKSLSERTHVCWCGCVLDRDENAARNILRLGLEYLEATYRGAHGNEEGLPSATLGEPLPLLPASAG